MESQISLIYFSCQGREHLLTRTAEALEKHCLFSFHEKILAFDGPMDAGFSPAEIGVTRLVNNVTRTGYVQSVRNALSLVTTPYFFWQEDDCRFLRTCDVKYLHKQMESNSSWTQVGWGSGEKLPPEEKIYPMGTENMYRTAYGFSARPALCRTDDLREAFAMNEGDAINPNQDIEEYLRDWLKLKSKASISIDPGDASMYVHEGQLESVDKGLLQMKPEGINGSATYKSGLGHRKLPPLPRRVKNLCNLLMSAFRLCYSQFHDLSRYDVAWRVVRIERITRQPGPRGDRRR